MRSISIALSLFCFSLRSARADVMRSSVLRIASACTRALGERVAEAANERSVLSAAASLGTDQTCSTRPFYGQGAATRTCT